MWRTFTLEALAENQSYSGADPSRVVAHAETQASIDAKGIAKLVIKAAEDVGSGRGVRL